MDIFRRLFSKASTGGIFSFVFPQAPASLQNPEFLKAYKGWVYACVRAIATDVGTMELQLQRKSADGWAEVKSHPAIDLLTSINPFLTSDGLFKAVSSFIDLTGNAFVYVAYNGRQPKELWLLDPTKVEVTKDATNFISGWVYTNPQGKKIKLETWEVIPFQDFNPEDPYKGKGPVEAAALAIDTNRYAGEWNRNFFFNSAMPSMVLETEQKLTPEVFERLETQWLQKFQGLKNAHRPAVLEGGLKVNVLNKGQKDMDFVTQGHALRDEILAMFGVPKSVLGIVEDVNRANAEASEYVFAKRTVAPRERFIAGALSEFYLPLWGLSPADYRLFPKDSVPQNVETELKRKEAGLKNGYYTINEVRAEEGKEPVDGGDDIYIPSSLIPLTAETRGMLPTLAPGGNANDDEKKPPKGGKSVTKAAETDKRAAFLTKTITKAQKQIEGLYTEQAAFVATALTSKKSIEKLEGDTTDPLATAVSEPELLELVFTDWEKFIPGLIAILTTVDGQVYSYAGEHTIASAGLDLTFDLANPRAEQWLRDRGLQSATSINETMREEIRARLVQGVADGKGAKEIAGDISVFFDEQSEWRALRVARTEVIEAYAQGSLEAARQGGFDEKRWIAANDARVDEECLMNAAAGWIPRETAFPSGHVSPVVHPNCRCDVEFRRAA